MRFDVNRSPRHQECSRYPDHA